MKKGGILNPAICSLLAELGHMDELLIVDAGYPLPPDAHVIDLTLTPGIPRFLDVLRAVAEELVIESITVASEITEFSPKLYQEIIKTVGDIDIDEVPHHEFKEQSMGVKGNHSHSGVHSVRERAHPLRLGVLNTAPDTHMNQAKGATRAGQVVSCRWEPHPGDGNGTGVPSFLASSTSRSQCAFSKGIPSMERTAYVERSGSPGNVILSTPPPREAYHGGNRQVGSIHRSARRNPRSARGRRR